MANLFQLLQERAEKRAGIMQERKGVGFSVVVTSFEVVMKDRRFLANLPWKYLVVDEVGVAGRGEREERQTERGGEFDKAGR